jgi:hypothetical protein
MAKLKARRRRTLMDCSYFEDRGVLRLRDQPILAKRAFPLSRRLEVLGEASLSGMAYLFLGGGGPLAVSLIGSDYVLHQRMTDHVPLREMNKGNALAP